MINLKCMKCQLGSHWECQSDNCECACRRWCLSCRLEQHQGSRHCRAEIPRAMQMPGQDTQGEEEMKKCTYCGVRKNLRPSVIPGTWVCKNPEKCEEWMDVVRD
jgi:hypothetical protein